MLSVLYEYIYIPSSGWRPGEYMIYRLRGEHVGDIFPILFRLRGSVDMYYMYFLPNKIPHVIVTRVIHQYIRRRLLYCTFLNDDINVIT